MRAIAKGTFDIEFTPGAPELQGAVRRLDFTKTFHGDLQASGMGVMLSSGDPEQGAAGYVAIETVSGALGDLQGSFALQQFGTLNAGAQTLHYEIVPGSGHDDLAGLTGTFRLTIDEEGTHCYELEYEL